MYILKVKSYLVQESFRCHGIVCVTVHYWQEGQPDPAGGEHHPHQLHHLRVALQ